MPVPATDDIELLTPPEVARKLKVSVKTVRREIARGHLPAYKVADQWRILKADLLRYLAARRSGGYG